MAQLRSYSVYTGEESTKVDLNDEKYMQEFYEEISLMENSHEQGQTDTPGLSQESVHKLTEDLMNPLPPIDTED